jgi:hypothetical protein
LRFAILRNEISLERRYRCRHPVNFTRCCR